MTFDVTVLSMFPEAFPGPLGVSLIDRAREDGLWQLDVVDLKPFSSDARGFLDDTPAGGGPGQVMRADVIGAAVDSLPDDDRPRVYLSARGRRLDQATVRRLAAGPGLVALCGRFEGVDQRVIEARGFEEWSIGDYVLAGGEVAAQVLIEACVRTRPHVLGQEASLAEESYENGLLEYPQYTRPREWDGHLLPDVLLTGDHKKIAGWRQQMSERTTRERRPDLWRQHCQATGRPVEEQSDECD